MPASSGSRPREIPYDSLIVAAGVNQSYFGHDEFALYAPGMKTIDDALELRRRIFGAFEMAEMADDPGREGAVAHRGHRRRRADRGRAGRPGPRAGRAQPARRVPHLRRRPRYGSSCSTGASNRWPPSATSCRPRRPKSWSASGWSCAWAPGWWASTPSASTSSTPTGPPAAWTAHTTVWAAGVEASPLAAELAKATGAELDRAGRIAVLPDLTLPGHPEVFVVGDMMALDKLPGVAEVAMQGGLHAANTIVRRLKGQAGCPFKYRDLGSAATIGRFRSVVDFRGCA